MPGTGLAGGSGRSQFFPDSGAIGFGMSKQCTREHSSDSTTVVCGGVRADLTRRPLLLLSPTCPAPQRLLGARLPGRCRQAVLHRRRQGLWCVWRAAAVQGQLQGAEAWAAAHRLAVPRGASPCPLPPKPPPTPPHLPPIYLHSQSPRCSATCRPCRAPPRPAPPPTPSAALWPPWALSRPGPAMPTWPPSSRASERRAALRWAESAWTRRVPGASPSGELTGL